MSAKSAVRFVIGIVIAFFLLSLVLPVLGIPRSQMLFPTMAYAGATKQTTGVVTAKKIVPTSNIFHSGTFLSLVDYEFSAPPPPSGGLGNKENGAAPPKPSVYRGRVNADEEWYGGVKVGDRVPVKYDPTYPSAVSGIPLPGAGRNGMGGGNIFSMWVIWAIVSIILGYLIAGFLERIMLRESY